MATQLRTFGLALGGTVVGLAIMLYGVSLNSGTGPNAPIAVGGVIVLVAFALLAGGVIALDDGSEAA